MHQNTPAIFLIITNTILEFQTADRPGGANVESDKVYDVFSLGAANLRSTQTWRQTDLAEKNWFRERTLKFKY